MPAPVKTKEIVETNGYSDIFPPGLPIGVVQHVGDSPDGISYFLRVKLFANFPTLREVSVITNYSSSERRELEEMATDPIRQDSVLNKQDKQVIQEKQKDLEEKNPINTDTIR